VVAPGVRKAAILLASLDPETGAELLKAARPELLTEIAAELVWLDSGGATDADVREPIREFMSLLHSPPPAQGENGSFVRRLLTGALGAQRTEEVFGQAQRGLLARDPFLSVREVEVPLLARALEGQHPQVAALVLLELPPARSAALIPALEERVRGEAVRRMTCGEAVSREAKVRVAAMLQGRLESLRKADAQEASGGPTPAAPVATATPAAKARATAHLRRVALLLRGLATELRDSLVKAIADQNADAAAAVQNLMILWEDMPQVADRSIQEATRGLDARKLALALAGADPATRTRIVGNLSERTRAMIDEEAQLMKQPKAEEIEQAREEILAILRALSAKGELQFQGA